MRYNEFLEDKDRILQEKERFISVFSEELSRADEALKDLKRNVACFGSARILDTHPRYQEARALARELSNSGYNILTGGGPGLMEAANLGAKEGQARSVGLLIQLPKEQRPNAYLDYAIEFKHFFTRKITFARHAMAFVIFPGGFGTIDELSEVLTLIQTRKMERKPFIFYGKDFWDPLLGWFEDKLLSEGMIQKEDLKLYQLCDTTDEVLAHIENPQ